MFSQLQQPHHCPSLLHPSGKREGQLQARIRSDIALTAPRDRCFPCAGVLAAQQDERLVLGTADCRSISSRLSAERRQRDRVLPFPQAAEELPAQLSTAGFPMLYYCRQGEGSRASTKCPHPWDLCQDPQDGGTLQTGEPWQPAAPAQVAAPSQQSHKAAAGWKADLEGAKALLLCPSGAPQLHNGDTVYVPSVLNYLDGSQKAQTSLCLCLAWGSAGSSLVEAAQSCLLPAPAASYLLWAAKRSCVFPQPKQHRLSTQQGSSHTGRTPPGCWSQTGTLPEARSSISKQGGSPFSLQTSLAHRRQRKSCILGREPYLFHGHRIALVVDSTHTGDTQQRGPVGWARLLGQNSHREISFFRRADQSAGRGSTQLGSSHPSQG